MVTETTVLDFKLSNTFDEQCTHIKSTKQQTMFKDMGAKTFSIRQCKDDPKRATFYVRRSLKSFTRHLL